MWGKILFILACLLLPIAWGVLVDWIFNNWKRRTNGEKPKTDDDTYFPDFQI